MNTDTKAKIKSQSKILSSAFKVGFLTIISILILIFAILWIKGRTLTGGERITVSFKDANGIRPGSQVQLMGYRIGQVEDVIPIIEEENSHVDIKFVITEKNLYLPDASTISIQQSGLIGEQFLEITPPQPQTIYLPAQSNTKTLSASDKVEVKFEDGFYPVGEVKSVEIMNRKFAPPKIAEEFKSDYIYKIQYVITLPGLIIPKYEIEGKIHISNSNKSLRIETNGLDIFTFPKNCSKFTVIEPLRLSDFMDLQYRSARSFAKTNEKLSELLSDDVIADLKDSIVNIRKLTYTANTTMEKTQVLIESSKSELDNIFSLTNRVTDRIVVLTDNLNSIVADENFKQSILNTTDSVNRLSCNINKLLEDEMTKETLENINETSKNLAEISSFIQDATKDEQLKSQISNTVCKLNTALDQLSITLNTVNDLTVKEKETIKSTIKDVSSTAKEMKKFSQKLNKRFLLFRLMF